ncbi:hypothetical protein GA0115233_101915 [Streptomyces sp. DI166]|uniref:hypothetical protein n=1 Tax=Streptomyces sp. DI166 TaxID=1839783 RepID=UPI0007F34B19|nr:hypothetical protein [Streptomyces sp. DI166]SBT90469.1 hypothetical protein GA0115233_101915 [Streptomyces sp. DI166]
MRSVTARLGQVLTGRAGTAYRRFMDHCAACRTCRPELDWIGRAVGTPELCPEAETLRQEWDAARKDMPR